MTQSPMPEPDAFDRWLYADQLGLRFDVDPSTLPKVTFEQWPEFEQRAYRWAEALRNLHLAFADHPWLRRSRMWRDFWAAKAEEQRWAMIRSRSMAEALVWAKDFGRPVP